MSGPLVMPGSRSDRSGILTFLATTALGWGYYVLVIFAALSASEALQGQPLWLPRFELYHAFFLGTLHGMPAAGILALLATARLSPNGRALPLVAATLAGAVVIPISFFPPFPAYEELDLAGSAARRYAVEVVERLGWWHWLLLAGVQIPFLTECWLRLKPNAVTRDTVLSRL